MYIFVWQQHSCEMFDAGIMRMLIELGV